MIEKKEVLLWDGPEGLVMVKDATREQLLEIVAECYREIARMRRLAETNNNTWAALCGVASKEEK